MLEKSTAVGFSNIALIKYWGKKAIQRPLNPSVSLRLDHCSTEMSAQLVPVTNQLAIQNNRSVLKVGTVEHQGLPRPAFAHSLQQRLDRLWASGLRLAAPWQGSALQWELNLASRANFPEGVGIASSASSMSALAQLIAPIIDFSCLALEDQVSGFSPVQQQSFIARILSGSACRSLWPGYVWWGEDARYPWGSDLIATPLAVHEQWNQLQDIVLVVSSEEKKVSSTLGHERMEQHFFRQGRVQQVAAHLQELLALIEKPIDQRFFELLETEALSLHGLMLSSREPFCLLLPSTLELISSIQRLRQYSGIPCGFTLDAGPTVHLLVQGPWQSHPALVQWLEAGLPPGCRAICPPVAADLP